MTFIHEEWKVLFIAFCNFHDQQAEERDIDEFFLHHHQSSFFMSQHLELFVLQLPLALELY
jgi:hypothetical protein